MFTIKQNVALWEKLWNFTLVPSLWKTLIIKKQNYLFWKGANRTLLANRSAAWLFEKVNNGLLSAESYSNSVEHMRWSFFYENSWRAVPVNNICIKIHLILHLRDSEFNSDLKHSDKEYIYVTMDILHILCCKGHL